LAVPGQTAAPSAVALPVLHFAVGEAVSADHVAAPTLRFPIEIEAERDQPIRSVLLDIQIQIAARRRGYAEAESERLLELFGTPDRWATTLRTLLWTRTTLIVPPFTGATVKDLMVPCSYDLEITASRYFAALEDGEVPLEFLFSGTVFYSTPQGALQMARLSWEHEADTRLPVAVWRAAMDRHFPGGAWLRLGRDSFDRVCAYKARHAFESWDQAIDSLVAGADGGR
jgi:Family of unknown function (DUF6084)